MKKLLTRESVKQVMVSRGWLALQPESFRDAFLDISQIQHYDTGSHTHHIGDEFGGMFGIVTGSFGALGQSHSFGLVMGHILRAGSWFGEGPAAMGTRRLLSFRAMEPSMVLHVPLPALERLQRNDPAIRPHLMTLVAYNAMLLTRALSDLLIRRADQRIAAVILRVTGADEYAGPYEVMPVQVTQSDLAELANCSRHTMNTTLKKFEQYGWVSVGYGTLTVINPDGLRLFLGKDG